MPWYFLAVCPPLPSNRIAHGSVALKRMRCSTLRLLRVGVGVGALAALIGAGVANMLYRSSLVFSEARHWARTRCGSLYRLPLCTQAEVLSPTDQEAVEPDTQLGPGCRVSPDQQSVDLFLEPLAGLIRGLSYRSLRSSSTACRSCGRLSWVTSHTASTSTPI